MIKEEKIFKLSLLVVFNQFALKKININININIYYYYLATVTPEYWYKK